MDVEFYDLVWFWNNQSDDTKPMLVSWIGVSHMVGSVICYWIISEKCWFCHTPPFSNLLITNQGTLMSKNIYVINMACWKTHSEVRTLLLV